MLKKISFRRFIIASFLLIVSLILYNFPEELQQHISVEERIKKEKIYLIDFNDYVAMTEMISKSDSTLSRAKEIIESLTINSDYAEDVPAGFKAIIPEGTKLLDCTIEEGLIKLNFSDEFLNVAEDDENLMIEAIVFSLTSLDDIEKVMIFVEGERLLKLPKSGKKLDLYLDRDYGINKIYDITSFNDVKMVTVYYLSKDKDYYYVPVSYIVNDERDKVDIIIENLKSYSVSDGNLLSHLDYQLQLMDYDLSNDTLSLNFNSVLLSSVYDGKLKEEVKYAISYSIMDSLDVNNIVFEVDSHKIDTFGLEI